MKPLTTEEKAKLYEEAIEQAKKELATCGDMNCDAARQIFRLFPELKESEDERIRQRIIHALHGDVLEMSEIKEAIAWLEKQGEMDMESYKVAEDEKREFVGDGFIKCYANFQDFKEGETYWLEYVGNDNYNVRSDNLLGKTYHITPCQLYTVFKKQTWLEKQGTPAKLSEEEQNRFAKGVLSSCALSFIDYLDAHKYEGKMCVSNGECEDIENAFHNAMWDRLHRYYCKYIEKQGEQKPNPYSGTSFDYDGHTWGMCARDNGVEILFDGELKAFLSLEKSFIYPIHSQPELAPKSAKEALFDYENANIQQKDFAPKIEPKFHKGEWVVSKLDRKARQISEVHCDEYNDYYIVEGDEYQIEEYDRLHHLWTIQDAKDGDVLFYDSTCGFTFIYNGINSEGALLYSYVESNDGSPLLKYNIGKPNVGIGYVTDKNIYPATKEQRDLLFQKMEEAGYEWDAEKKEPKRIEPQPSQWNISDFRTWQYIVCDVLTKYNGIGQYLDNGLCKQIAKYMQENWSKNLIQPQNTWKPSDEQMEAMNTLIINIVRNPLLLDNFTQANLKTLYDDLKKLREE